MTSNPAHIVGIYEHPTRKAVGVSLAQLHADVAKGALEDAGLALSDIDGYFCAADAPGIGGMTIAQHLGLDLRYSESTETGGSSYIGHVRHAAMAIQSGKCSVALITCADNQVASREFIGLGGVSWRGVPEVPFEDLYHTGPAALYGLVAQRHMYEFGTTSEQLAWVKVAASHHAQHNPNALLQNVVTVEEVVNSPIVASPLHRLDCCVMSDGGGAIILTNAEIARTLNRPLITLKGAGEAVKHNNGGKVDLSYSAGQKSAAMAFAEAGVTPADIKYASLYDSFTITVIMQLEDVGFCKKGEGGKFAADGNLISGVGKLPFNTDGGGLCNNHPGNRGGITKLLEAVRQLRGEAHPAVQVKDCDLAVAHGTGGSLAGYHGSATAILERN
ncbi:thiolase domain-containing protein [Henriciella mobilis]|uniref:Thiolase domain-containing protein n=1 Tax=Henriciella mobilis TaxID=2305467 RepID=A0A399R7S9_9PROT|nr:thiolase domain-containing protein [Henriciella mobilis]RIJ26823.1 thiolase domain-containing protein [Henriciella mobilis]